SYETSGLAAPALRPARAGPVPPLDTSPPSVYAHSRLRAPRHSECWCGILPTQLLLHHGSSPTTSRQTVHCRDSISGSSRPETHAAPPPSSSLRPAADPGSDRRRAEGPPRSL